MIFIKNLAESSDENSDKSFVSFYFDFVTENCHDDVDQNFHSIAESYFFLKL